MHTVSHCNADILINIRGMDYTIQQGLWKLSYTNLNEVFYHSDVTHRCQPIGIIMGSDDDSGCILPFSRKHSLK